MLQEILENIALAKKVTSRENVLEEVDKTITMIDTNIIPGIEAIIGYSKENKTENKVLDRLVKIAKRYKLDVDNEIMVLNEFKSFFKEVVDNEEILVQQINNNLDRYSTDKTTTVKGGAIISFVASITSSTAYMQDYLLFMSYAFSSDRMLKKKESEIDGNIYNFFNIYKAYRKKMKNVIEDFSGLSDNRVTEESAESVKSLFNKTESKFILPLNLFKGNPIWHYRRWKTDGDIAKYEILKDKARLTELKILDLKTKGENEDIRKQIEYYENKINKIEKRLRDIEDS